MLDVIIACIVIGIPSVLALLVIDRASHATPTYRTREQELGAAGMFPEVRTHRRVTAGFDRIEHESPVLPTGATGDRGVILPTAPSSGAPELVAPPAIQHS